MSSKDLGSKWNFLDRRKASMGQSREDSSFAPFVQNKVRCLVREYIQNSLDAHSKNNPDVPVEVSFTYGELICREYPELILSLRERMVACSDHCKAYENSKNPYENKIEYMDSRLDSTMGYLKVADYNTTGMSYVDDDDTPCAFKACVRESSASYKDTENAGGSHGLGKTVGFVNSGINAVYYSTMDEDGNKYGEGVIKLCDHKLVDRYGVSTNYESTAFYDRHDGESPNFDNEIPEAFMREKPGTDAYVLGIEKNEDDIITMKREILRSFFKAIAEGQLTVTVEGDHIYKNSLYDKLIELYPDGEYGEYDSKRTNTPWLEFNPRPYYAEVLAKNGEDDDHITLEAETDFPGQFPLLGKARLIMWKSDSIKEAGSRDSVVYMRDNAMVIEVKRGRNNKGYYAICVCDGVGSKYLRKTENVTHDKWDLAELRDINKTEKDTAKKTLDSIKAFVAACEAKVFPEEKDKERIIASLKRHRLGSTSNRTSDTEEDNIWPTTNVTEGVKNTKTGETPITILETKKGGKKKKKAKGTPTTPIPPAEPGGEPKSGSGPEPGPNPEPPTPTPPTIPAVEGESEVEGTESKDTPKGKHMKAIKLDGSSRFLVPLHDGEFACKLVIKVPQDYEGCRIALNVQGVSGKMPLELKRVSEGCRIVGDNNNEITGFDLKQGQNNVIKFTHVESIKNYSLIIEAYGN